MQPGRDSEASGLLRAARPRVYKSCQQTEKPAEISCQFLFSDTKGNQHVIAHIKFRVNYRCCLQEVVYYVIVDLRALGFQSNCFMVSFHQRNVLRSL